ncbi:glycoprotein 38 family [Trichomonas vaginalis G3]|uniref:glycoprotein 38 family n=1 Tax=Trichomonas vaginalis (strain ATCC PRA-98 / G3) TaxID=412133 RepID=UPI0021E5F728|nr:glycoprotein 38 family [Trichomonas vaginalis G3]KAI5514402.1 glycoprotein 38 family [Trichomonas vaginalis G3]
MKKGNEGKIEQKGEFTLKFEKIGDPPEGEEMLFEKEKLYLFNPENKIKTKKEVEKDTQKYDNPGLKGYQIALIVIAVVVVIVIIVVVVILLLKKGKESPKSNSGSGSGENA